MISKVDQLWTSVKTPWFNMIYILIYYKNNIYQFIFLFFKIYLILHINFYIYLNIHCDIIKFIFWKYIEHLIIEEIYLKPKILCINLNIYIYRNILFNNVDLKNS